MDDFDDGIFDEDEALDCSLLEEIEREEGKPVNQGCFGTIVIFVGVLSAMTFGIAKLLAI